RVLPPTAAAPVDHGGERAIRDDAGIGVLPSVAMHLGDRVSVAQLGPADIDSRGGHIKVNHTRRQVASQESLPDWRVLLTASILGSHPKGMSPESVRGFGTETCAHQEPKRHVA